MTAVMILKIFSDCCVCFAILGSGPVEYRLPMLLPALLCGVAAGIAAFFQDKGLVWLRRLCGLLPLGILLLAENKGHGLLLAVPALYTAFVILWNKLELEYYAYRRFFLRSLALLGGAYLAVNVWIFLAQVVNDRVPGLDTGVILRYGLVHLFCGVILQRQLRLGVGSRSAGGRRQIALLLGTGGGIALGFLVAEPLLRRSLGTVLGYVFSLVLTPLGLLVEWVLRLFTSLGDREDVEKDYQEFLDYMESIGMGGGVQNGQPSPSDTPTSFDGTVIWGILVTVFLVIAAVLLVRSFHRRRNDMDTGERTARLENVPKKKRQPRLSNRGSVRQTYRDFLRAEKNRGMRLQKSDTSADVLAHIHKDTDLPSASALRQVYLAARYDDRQNITRAQVEAAKRALKGTRRAK